MSDLNIVIVHGRVTRNPELRVLASGTSTATIPIAVNTQYGKGDEQKKETIFFDCIVWEKRAEVCCEWLQKGSSVIVNGRLKQREWTTKDGEARKTLEIAVGDIKFLDKLKAKDEESSEAPAEEPSGEDILF